MIKYIFIIVLVIHNYASAQVIDQIKRDANKNQNNRQSSQNNKPSPSSSTPNYNYNTNQNNIPSNRSTSTTNSNDISPADCSSAFSACASCITYVGPLLTKFFELVAKEQNKQLGRKDTMPDVSSLELMFDANFGHNEDVEQYLFRPRLRLNYGIFTSDFRIYNLNEKTLSGELFSYNFYDWQIIMLNLVNHPKGKLRIGTGFSHESFTKTNYWENSVFAMVRPHRSVNVTAELRLVRDNITKIDVRREFNFGLDYKIMNRDKFNLHLGANASLVKFYENIQFWTFGPTVLFRLQ